MQHRPLFGEDSFRFVQRGVTNYIYVEDELDAVLHFASRLDYLPMLTLTLEVGSLGTRKTLSLSPAKTLRFVPASTSEVYGDPERLTSPPRNLYDHNADPAPYPRRQPLQPCITDPMTATRMAP